MLFYIFIGFTGFGRFNQAINTFIKSMVLWVNLIAHGKNLSKLYTRNTNKVTISNKNVPALPMRAFSQWAIK